MEMTRIVVLRLLLAATLLQAPFCIAVLHADTVPTKTFSPIETSFNKINAISAAFMQMPEKVDKISTVYAQEIKPLQRASTIDNLSTDDVALIFRAADYASFYAMKPDYVRDMELDIKAMASRGKAQNNDYVELYGAYVGLRDFDKARQLLKDHPGIQVPVLPALDVQAAPSAHEVLKISEADGSVKSAIVNLDHGATVVVVGHPLCHYSRNAVAAIEGDARLDHVFKEHSVWIAPPDRNLDDVLIKDWNAHHEFAKFAVVYSRAAWAGLNTWETPIFYFYKDGVLKDTLVGWPAEGNKAALEKGLHSIGIDTASTAH